MSKDYYRFKGGVIKRSMNVDFLIDMCVCASSEDEAISLLKSHWHYPEDFRIDSIRKTTSDSRIKDHGKRDSLGVEYVIDASSRKYQI